MYVGFLEHPAHLKINQFGQNYSLGAARAWRDLAKGAAKGLEMQVLSAAESDVFPSWAAMS